MSETPWTPGPWEIEETGMEVWGTNTAVGPALIVASYAPEADARLIAAAPEMAKFLAMLEREPFASAPTTRDEACALLARIRGDVTSDST